jgi:hypothetical protein
VARPHPATSPNTPRVVWGLALAPLGPSLAMFSVSRHACDAR